MFAPKAIGSSLSWIFEWTIPNYVECVRRIVSNADDSAKLFLGQHKSHDIDWMMRTLRVGGVEPDRTPVARRTANEAFKELPLALVRALEISLSRDDVAAKLFMVPDVKAFDYTVPEPDAAHLSH